VDRFGANCAPLGIGYPGPHFWMASLAAAFASSSTDCRLKKTLNRNRKLLFICMVWNHSCTTTPVCVTGFAFAKLLASIVVVELPPLKPLLALSVGEVTAYAPGTLPMLKFPPTEATSE